MTDHLTEARTLTNQAYLLANVAPGEAFRHLVHAMEHLADVIEELRLNSLPRGPVPAVDPNPLRDDMTFHTDGSSEKIFPVRDEAAIKLLKFDPEAFFAKHGEELE